jgi:hypothetical protein
MRTPGLLGWIRHATNSFPVHHQPYEKNKEEKVHLTAFFKNVCSRKEQKKVV